MMLLLLLQAAPGSGSVACDAAHYYAHALVADFLQRQPSKCPPPWQGRFEQATSAAKHLAVLLLAYGQPQVVGCVEQWLGVQPADCRAIQALHSLWGHVVKLTSCDDIQLTTNLGIIYTRDGQYSKAEPMLRQVCLTSHAALCVFV